MDGRRQGAKSRFCDMWHISICFYDNLFSPDENSKVQNKKLLNKKKIENLLNKHFVLDVQETNEATITHNADTNNIIIQ